MEFFSISFCQISNLSLFKWGRALEKLLGKSLSKRYDAWYMLVGICTHTLRTPKFLHTSVITYGDFMVIVEPCEKENFFCFLPCFLIFLFIIPWKCTCKIWSVIFYKRIFKIALLVNAGFKLNFQSCIVKNSNKNFIPFSVTQMHHCLGLKV